MRGDHSLLGTDDPPPVIVTNPQGRSSFLLVCDHAGRRVPSRLGDLGVAPADWDRHIAWDIGIAGVCAALAPLLDAVCIEQVFSRLVIDCNRRPGHPTSIPPASDGTAVPGNLKLTETDKAARVEAIFRPYHDAIAAEIDRRRDLGQPTILIAMHSFTPVFGGISRVWQAGVLHNRDPRLGRALAALLTQAGYHVGDNEPYSLSDESDYTVPVHAERRGLPYVELEIRQDLIAEQTGQAYWATLLSRLLPAALHACDLDPGAAGGD